MFGGNLKGSIRRLGMVLLLLLCWPCPAPAEETPAPAGDGTSACDPRDGYPQTDIWTVQIAAFAATQNGESLARESCEQIRQAGYAAYVVKVKLGKKGTWYRVTVGEFTTEAAARSLAKRLDEVHYETWIQYVP